MELFRYTMFTSGRTDNIFLFSYKLKIVFFLKKKIPCAGVVIFNTCPANEKINNVGDIKYMYFSFLVILY